MKNLKLDAAPDNGWMIHIYDRNRRLCCTLEPSHGWVFGAGLSLGALITLIGVNLNIPDIPKTSPAETPLPSSAGAEQLSRAHEFLFWID